MLVIYHIQVRLSGLPIVNAAVCKLFMGYHNRPGREYVGTGWLIGDDLVVTAGHCLYDWRDDGGFLKYIKVYIGYNGPDSVTDENCQYRRGVVAAAPAEYLKAASFTHDVGFVSNTIYADTMAATYAYNSWTDSTREGIHSCRTGQVRFYTR